MSKTIQLSLLKLLNKAPRELDELARKANMLADAYRQVLVEEGSKLGGRVYEAISKSVSFASNRLYGEAVRLASREATSLARSAVKSPEEFVREAWSAYMETALPDIPVGLIPVDPARTKIDLDLIKLLAQILHAAYLVSGSWDARYSSIFTYAIYSAGRLRLDGLVRLLLLTPASYKAYRNGDREWSLALLGWPLESILRFKPMREAEPPINSPRPWSAILLANYLRDVAIPMNQEVLYKWSLHRVVLEYREESY
ncbi:MAG: hypothetical protein F7C07_03630 [Desulfurococcales archaeon]|nr:hypothetical protein [Desulfurococcales archaeon]